MNYQQICECVVWFAYCIEARSAVYCRRAYVVFYGFCMGTKATLLTDSLNCNAIKIYSHYCQRRAMFIHDPLLMIMIKRWLIFEQTYLSFCVDATAPFFFWFCYCSHEFHVNWILENVTPTDKKMNVVNKLEDEFSQQKLNWKTFIYSI